jgi:hypothetical protein
MDDPYTVLARAERLEQELFEVKARAERAEDLDARLLRAVELLGKCAEGIGEAKEILRKVWREYTERKAGDAKANT